MYYIRNQDRKFMTSLHISNWVRCEFGPFIQTNPPEKPCWNIICRKTTKLIDWEHKLILNEPYAMHIFHSFSYRKTTKRLYHVIADKWINRYLIHFTQSNMLANSKWKTQTKRTEKKRKTHPSTTMNQVHEKLYLSISVVTHSTLTFCTVASVAFAWNMKRFGNIYRW